MIDGNFSGALAAGKVLVFSDRASAVSAQYDYFVYFAATTDTPPNIGTSTDKPLEVRRVTDVLQPEIASQYGCLDTNAIIDGDASHAMSCASWPGLRIDF